MAPELTQFANIQHSVKPCAPARVCTCSRAPVRITSARGTTCTRGEVCCARMLTQLRTLTSFTSAPGIAHIFQDVLRADLELKTQMETLQAAHFVPDLDTFLSECDVVRARSLAQVDARVMPLPSHVCSFCKSATTTGLRCLHDSCTAACCSSCLCPVQRWLARPFARCVLCHD